MVMKKLLNEFVDLNITGFRKILKNHQQLCELTKSKTLCGVAICSLLSCELKLSTFGIKDNLRRDNSKSQISNFKSQESRIVKIVKIVKFVKPVKIGPNYFLQKLMKKKSISVFAISRF